MTIYDRFLMPENFEMWWPAIVKNFTPVTVPGTLLALARLSFKEGEYYNGNYYGEEE